MFTILWILVLIAWIIISIISVIFTFKNSEGYYVLSQSQVGFYAKFVQLLVKLKMIGKISPDFEVKDPQQCVDNDNYLGIHQT